MKRPLIIAFLAIAVTQSRASCVDTYKCVQEYGSHYHVPPDFIAALIDVESRWNPHAVSDKGALGLMQLMPETARRFGAFHPFDVEENIAAGTRY